MENIIGLHAYKKEGEAANVIGIVEYSDITEYAFQIRSMSGNIVAGFNSMDEIIVVEFGDKQ